MRMIDRLKWLLPKLMGKTELGILILFVLVNGLAPWGRVGAETLGETSEAAKDRVPRALNLPESPFDYGLSSIPKRLLPTLNRLDNTPPDNPASNHGATLGRVLFYDQHLSVNKSTSCASCHLQKYGFAEPKPTSIGFDGKSVTRNSMALVNLRFYRRGRFFWDERAADLEQQVLLPIENQIEMGHLISDLIPQLQSDPIYPSLFKNAFGDPEINEQRLARALAQFVRSIVSFQSRYDVGLSKVQSPLDPFPNFTDQENLGKQQFFGRARCADCHLPGHDDSTSPQWLVFQLDRPTNNGLDIDGLDLGVATHTARPQDRGHFKASSLRNIAVTGPYMHDGRFITLDQVIEHYNWSVKPHENLDARLAEFSANGLALPEVPKVALAAFLETLTDQSVLTAEKFSDPFVRSPVLSGP